MSFLHSQHTMFLWIEGAWNYLNLNIIPVDIHVATNHRCICNRWGGDDWVLPHTPHPYQCFDSLGPQCMAFLHPQPTVFCQRRGAQIRLILNFESIADSHMSGKADMVGMAIPLDYSHHLYIPITSLFQLWTIVYVLPSPSEYHFLIERGGRSEVRHLLLGESLESKRNKKLCHICTSIGIHGGLHRHNVERECMVIISCG